MDRSKLEQILMQHGVRQVSKAADDIMALLPEPEAEQPAPKKKKPVVSKMGK